MYGKSLDYAHVVCNAHITSTEPLAKVEEDSRADASSEDGEESPADVYVIEIVPHCL